jgi:N-acetylglucosaminyldiphosphoundecaprenol N-acetyl-beta-D-mannosaminyltransferase
MNLRISAFGITMDAVTMPQAIETVLEWVETGDDLCRYLVTPNVDHIVKLQNNKKFRNAYADASLVLVDGRPVFFALKILGKPAPETIAGSDFVPRLFETAQGKKALKVFWLGAGPGVAAKAAERVESIWKNIYSVGSCSPPYGFEKSTKENQKILKLINTAQPDILIVGLGAPRQELWVHANHKKIKAKVVLCAGATIDFLAEKKIRAPVLIRRLSLEWLYRMLSEPRRLAGRYIYDALFFPGIILKERCKNRSP